MSKVLAFLVRDYQIHRTYRLFFAMELAGLLLNIIPYYFLSRFVGDSLRDDLQQYGGDYFAFILVGLALSDYLIVPLSLFSRHIRESQLNGTLEAVLSTQTALHTVVISSAIYPFIWASIKATAYVGIGIALVGVPANAINWGAAAAILILALAVFAGIGVLSASFILVFKQGDPLTFLISGMSWVFAGIIYPVTILPAPLRTVSDVMPIRYAIDGMRGAILQNASWNDLWASIGPLFIFAIILLPLSLAAFSYANKNVRISGSLGDY